MNPVTQGGILNDARSMAIVSHLILSITMMAFFYILPDIFSVKNRNTKLVRFFGVLTMIGFVFMYTEYHDSIVTLTAVLGTIALIPFFIEVNKYPKKGLPAFGLLLLHLKFHCVLHLCEQVGLLLPSILTENHLRF